MVCDWKRQTLNLRYTQRWATMSKPELIHTSCRSESSNNSLVVLDNESIDWPAPRQMLTLKVLCDKNCLHNSKWHPMLDFIHSDCRAMFLVKVLLHAPMQTSQILDLFPADEVSCLPAGCSALSRIFSELKVRAHILPTKATLVQLEVVKPS